MFSSLINSLFTKLSPLRRSVYLPKFQPISGVCSNLHSVSNKPIEPLVDSNPENAQDLVKKVNDEIRNNPCRTFAVVHVCGKQFKVTPGDSIIIEGYWPPDVGDNIRLDKVLCAGSKSYSLFGTPLLEPGLVNVFATVIEKSLSHTKVHFKKKRRRQYMRINFYRSQRTLLRINDVEVGEVRENM